MHNYIKRYIFIHPYVCNNYIINCKHYNGKAINKREKKYIKNLIELYYNFKINIKGYQINITPTPTFFQFLSYQLPP